MRNRVKAVIRNLVICRRVQCLYCQAWFETDVELASHLNGCGY